MCSGLEDTNQNVGPRSCRFSGLSGESFKLKPRGSRSTFVTQLSSIVGVTETLPGFHTAAVDTAGVGGAPVTEDPLPPV